MPIKIENLSTITVSSKTLQWIENITDTVPREHLRGLEKIRLVNVINDARLKNLPTQKGLPGLYHPKQGAQAAWLEIAAGVLLPQEIPFHKRFMHRLSFKGNLAAVIFSLIGQHYHLTLRHSVKRSQVEMAVKNYTDKHLRLWHQKQNTLRTRLLKPFQPTIEKWARSLQKRAQAEQKKRQTTN